MNSLTILVTCSFWISGVFGEDALPTWQPAEQNHFPDKPTWEPTRSDEHFMKKDLPFDKRPKVDIIHFKHPYPIVQDSGDFDRDYVKDENSDNGEWNAQTIYDTLRHKLTKQRAEMKKAKEAEQSAQRELEEKQRKADAAAKAAAEASRRSDEIDKTKTKGSYDVTITRQKKTSHKAPDLGDEPDVETATRETQEAMAHLEDCKKELEEARENLKRLMKELDEAKEKTKETEEAFDAAESHLKRLKKDEDSVVKHVAAKKDDYLAAKKEYEAQLAVVNKLESEIKVASEKVKAMRDAEDDNGGVYNTPRDEDDNPFKLPKSAAPAFAIPSVLLAALTAFRL